MVEHLVYFPDQFFKTSFFFSPENIKKLKATSNMGFCHLFLLEQNQYNIESTPPAFNIYCCFPSGIKNITFNVTSQENNRKKKRKIM